MPEEPEPSSRLARLDPLVFLVAALLAVFAAIGILLYAARGSSNNQVSATGHRMYPVHVTPHARKGELVVAVGDYWFKPSTHRLHAGVYRFTTHNYGVVQHDVMVERTPIKFSSPGVPVDEAAPYGIDDLQSGMTKSSQVMLSAGRWELFCSVPSHYQSGQHQVITVYGQMPRGMRAPKPMGMGGEDSDAKSMSES
jgi:uncharacterized cupredoxin-like copper-binding protein